MLGRFEQEVCNISYVHSKQKTKINGYYMKKGPASWIAADFE